MGSRLRREGGGTGWLGNLLLLAASLLVSAFLLDRAILFLKPIAGLYRYASSMDFVMRPDHAFRFVTDEYDVVVRTDAEGKRRGGHAAAPDERRLLVLGDSFAFGYGVGDDETFPARLDGLLAPGGWVVANGGVAGYDTRREYEYFRAELEAGRRVDALVIQAFVNDPLSNSGEFRFAPVLTGPARHVIPFTGLDALASYLAHSRQKLFYKLGLVAEYREAEHFDCLRPGRCQQGWAATELWMRRIAELAASRGVPVALLHLPAIEELQDDQSLEAYDRQMARQKLAAMAERFGWRFVDPMADGRLGIGHYLPRDQHLNAEGNRLVAELLAN